MQALNLPRISPRVLVIGAGISGLTCAHELAMAGYEVTVIAETIDASKLVSTVAGAVWEWPPSVCGHHKDVASLKEAKLWCVCSYRRFQELAENPQSGVKMLPTNFYFTKPIESDPENYAKMLELIPRVEGYERDPHMASTFGVNIDFGLEDGYTYLAPIIDTPTYMKWFLKKCKRMGIRFLQRKLDDDLRNLEKSLLKEFGAMAIVNCSALGSYTLAGDETVNPHRGALIRVINDGKRFPKVDRPHCISHDGSDTQKMVFIVPRAGDRLCLGGLVETEEYSTNLTLEYPPIQAMWERCVKFFPFLENAEIDREQPLVCGLRPSRVQNIRCAREEGYKIIHNYGHGGGGWTMSWGCAAEVLKMTHCMMQEKEAEVAKYMMIKTPTMIEKKHTGRVSPLNLAKEEKSSGEALRLPEAETKETAAVKIPISLLREAGVEVDDGSWVLPLVKVG